MAGGAKGTTIAPVMPNIGPRMRFSTAESD
jgi:hypothetical protein